MTDKKQIGGAVAGSGGGCFRKGAKVQLEGGRTIAIEELRAGDSVLAFDESGAIHLAKVTKVHFHEDPQPILRVKFWKGETHITPNHWVLNQYDHFAEIGRMTDHDALVDGMGHLRPIIGAELVGYEPVYNLTVEPHHTFICDGIRVHNGGHRERYPEISGAGGGDKGSGRTPVEANDSVQSRAMVSMLDLLGEGEIGGLVNGAESIFFNDTPLANPDGSYNFQGVTWDWRSGTQNQTPMLGFSEVETPVQVGAKVKKDFPHTVAVTNPNADRIRAIVTIPSLQSINAETGDITGATVSYKFQISKDGGAYYDVLAGYKLIDGGTASTVDGFLTLTAAAGMSGVGASIALTPIDDFIYNEWGEAVPAPLPKATIQVQYWDGSSWIDYGAQKTIGGTAKTGLWGQIITKIAALAGSATWRTWVDSPQGVTTIRINVVSSENCTIGVYGVVKSFVSVPEVVINAKSSSRYQRHHLLTLPKPASEWNVRMVRLTDDSTSQKLANDTYFDTLVEIVDAKLNYPNSALVGVTIDSSLFSQIPRRSYLVNGMYIRVPSNYNPDTREYTGVWDGTFKVAVSDNPAWVLYDLLTNTRYGLGEHVVDVDKSSLYQIGRYCDELVPDGYGGTEPRFTINTAINAQSEAYKLVSDLTSVFRGMAFWTGGMVSFTQDAPRDASMVFSQSNVVDGMFSYTGSAKRDRHSVVLVSWSDPEENYKQKVEYVEDADLVAKFGIRKLETVAFGCNSRGQARRTGLWILYSEQYDTIVSFKVGVDAAAVLPGEVVKIHDRNRAGKRMAGRAKATGLTSVDLDAPVTLTAAGAEISIRMPDGSIATRTLVQGAGTHSTVSWATALAEVPLVGAMWVVSEASLEPLLARVISIAQGDNPAEFQIAALEYNPSKYAAIEQGLKLEKPKTSIINPLFVEAPQDIAVAESMYLLAPQVVANKLTVSWFGTSPTYEVEWRRPGAGENWQKVKTSVPAVEIQNIQEGLVELRVAAMNNFGKRSAYTEFTYDVIGKRAPPSDVANFVVTKRTTDLILTWDAVPDLDLSGYEIRVGNSWDDSQLVATQVYSTQAIHDQSERGTYRYHIRAIDTSGNYSAGVTTFVLDLPGPSAVQGFNCVQNGRRIEFKWRPNPEDDIVGYEIREGATWSSAKKITEIMGTTYTAPANAADGDRTFWIVAISSPGVYGKTPVFSTTTIAQASDRNVIMTQDEFATGFLGSKYNCEVQLDGSLELLAGKTYGEYTFGVTLPQQYRALNTIISTFDATVQDTEQWATTTYQWSAPQASRPWTFLGDVAAVDIDFFISKYQGLAEGAIEGFGMNNSVQGETGTLPATSVGVSYGVGRFLNGVRVGDFTTLDWNLALPAEFNVTFWVIPDAVVGNHVYWTCETATGLRLICGYDSAAGVMYLESTTGQKITVPYTVEVGDRVLLGIVQTATTRRLYVGALTKTPTSASGSYAPIGTIAKVKLHQ